jgi:hypothetical protein
LGEEDTMHEEWALVDKGVMLSLPGVFEAGRVILLLASGRSDEAPVHLRELRRGFDLHGHRSTTRGTAVPELPEEGTGSRTSRDTI